MVCVKNRMEYPQYHGEVYHDTISDKGRPVDEILRDYFPYPRKGVFFDVGAFEPIRISNSYHFEQNGWDCYCFEANTEGIPLLKEHRKNVFNCAIANEDKDKVSFSIVLANNWTASFSSIKVSEPYKQIFSGLWNGKKGVKEITVPQRSLNSILQTELPSVSSIDILSIDIEGGEYDCLRGLDLVKYDPKVIVVENATPADKTIQNYLESFEYRLHRTAGWNQFYISKNFSPL